MMLVIQKDLTGCYTLMNSEMNNDKIYSVAHALQTIFEN